MDDVAPLRLGIVGAASIARQFCRGVIGSPMVSIDAIASRDPNRAEAFAAELGIRRSYGSYMALFDDARIEAVYLPLPNHLHADIAIRALEAGKHVLCEKPMAIGGSEVRAMLSVAEELGLFVAEAYPYLSQPQTLRLREMLKDGTIGRPTTAMAAFGFALCAPDGTPLGAADNIRLDPEKGGGALLDAGTYPMSLLRVIAGERPSRVWAAGRWARTGVDLSVVATVEFPNGLLAQLSCGMAAAAHRTALVAGDGGAVQTDFSNHQVGPELNLLVRRGTASSVPFTAEPTPGGNGFRLEAEAFARAIRGGQSEWDGASPAESLDTALALEAIAASLRSGSWVELPAD